MTRRHPVHVTAYRIDFAVMRNHAERMRQIPGRESIRRETLMNQCQRTDHSWILQIRVIFTHLIG